jgi:uncharacterized lipoprotein YddW (UPF0748 family)
MKKIDESKLYYLKNRKLLIFSNKQIGRAAKFRQSGSTMYGVWIDDPDSNIICKRHEFFKIFTSKE